MRFALMIEPQQGLTYDDQLAIAKRAEATGFETLFRSDHYASFPGPAGQPTTDAWTVLAGLARETDRIGLGVLVSPVTFRHPGHLRQGRDDRRRDERRADRGRRRRRLERGRAPPARPRRSRRSASGPTCSRSSWRSSTACGASPTAGRSRAGPCRSRTRCSTRSRSTVPGRPTGAERRRRARGSSSAARGRRARSGSRPATPTSSTSARRARPRSRDDVRRGSTRRASRSGATRRRSSHSAMAGVLVGRDRRRGAPTGEAALLAAFGEPTTSEDWLEERRERWIAGTPDERARDGPPLRDGRRRAAHAPGLPALGPRHDRRDGRGPRSARSERPAAARRRVSRRLGRRAVARVVAPDRVGVRPARPGQPLGQELERRRRPEQRRDRRRQVRAPRRRASRPAGVRRRVELAVEVRGEDRRRADAERRARPRGAWRARASRSARPVAIGEDQDEAGRRVRSPAGGRGGTSRGRGRRTAARTPPRP